MKYIEINSAGKTRFLNPLQIVSAEGKEDDADPWLFVTMSTGEVAKFRRENAIEVFRQLRHLDLPLIPPLSGVPGV